jgi:Flp pilus assembly protein TadD
MHNPAPLLALLISLLALAAPVSANTLEAAQAQWAQGQRDQALQSVQRALASNPGDARLRFAQAVMQMEMGQPAAAEDGLRALTQDYPDLADPYNNLAVLHAARGELDLARQALEQAVRLQPEHAQAQENLGDVLLRLAARAYELALRQGSGDTSALQTKLKSTQGLIATQPAPRR